MKHSKDDISVKERKELRAKLRNCAHCDAGGVWLLPLVLRMGATVISCSRCGAQGPRYMSEWRKMRPDDRYTMNEYEAMLAWNQRRKIGWSEKLNPNGY